MSERELLSKQVDRLVNSHALHGSESLCKLLRYLARHTQEHPGIPLKEYQIATEVFGRRIDFDPQQDSTIRVQAGRLRAKLAEYYASAESAEDPLVVELPKGSYLLSYHHRTGGNGRNHFDPPPHEDLPAPAPSAPSSSFVAVGVLATLVLVCAAAIAFLLITRKSSDPALASEPVAAELRTLWRPFVTGPEEPWIVFSNAAFVGRPETGMRYYNSARDAADPVWDHYTGVGEVLAVHELDHLFTVLHRGLRVKRGSLFSLDDAKNNDLIFVGSPSENLTLMEIPTTKEFVFQRMASGPRKGDLAIVNVHPQPGEPPLSLASPANAPLTEDFAVIGLMPGLNPPRSIIILAGTTTFGTQGAVEYACRTTSVQRLLPHLSISGGGEVRPFEALLRVKVARGVPVETELIAVRQRAF